MSQEITVAFRISALLFLLLFAIACSPGTASVNYIVANNSQRNDDVFIDGEFAAGIDSGSWLAFRVSRSPHLFQNCARDKTPQENPEARTSHRVDAQINPSYLVIPGGTVPMPKGVVLILVNPTSSNQDFFLDGKFSARTACLSVPVRTLWSRVRAA